MKTPSGEQFTETAGILSISLEGYKKQFVQVLVLHVLLMLGSLLLVAVFPDNLSSFTIRRLSTPIMAMVFLLSLSHSLRQKWKLGKIDVIEDFDQKGFAYEKLYTYRLRWYLFSAAVSCCLFVLSLHWLFFAFALMDLLLLLGKYPNQQIFKRELKNNDIIFY